MTVIEGTSFSDDPIYPNIDVQLTGNDSNAFAIMGAVSNELKAHRVPTSEINKFRKECMSGNYDELLQTCMKWVNVY